MKKLYTCTYEVKKVTGKVDWGSDKLYFFTSLKSVKEHCKEMKETDFVDCEPVLIEFKKIGQKKK